MIVAAIALWAFVILESYAYRAEVVAIESEITSVASRDSYLSSIRNVLRGTEGDSAVIENRFIGEDDVPKFIEYLESEAARSRIDADLSGIVLEPVKKDNPWKTLRVRVSGVGEWKDAISFVHAIDMMDYAARIEKLSFTKAATGNGWNVAIDISQYLK